MKSESIFALPTLSNLGASLPSNFSLSHQEANQIASQWLSKLSGAVSSKQLDLNSIFIAPTPSSGVDGYWRDILALTWNLRTFAGAEKIRKFLEDRRGLISNIALAHEDHLALQRPYDDMVWIQFFFTFEVGDYGLATGVVRLVPTPSSEWKAHTVFTALESLKAYPEKIGLLREEGSNYRLKRPATDPIVLIVGGGQSGLEVAARLKVLGVSAVVIEREDRIGGNWRQRYESLCLHDPVWYDHMPYLPFPPNWPIYSPAIKLANWLESYADIMELDVLTSSSVTGAQYDAASGRWNVTVTSSSNVTTFRPKHVVYATGFRSGDVQPILPSYPGIDKFNGQLLHSLEHKKAEDHAGKKVVVIGACTSAHDIAADYYEHGIDVTMYQRSSTYVMTTKNGWAVTMKGTYEEHGPPTHIADLITSSFPNLMNVELGKRHVEQIANLDRTLLDGLRARGFRMNTGYRGAGALVTAWHKAGGYYLDTGASQLIVDGKIKLKNDTQIKCFTEDSILFENGTSLQADVVMFATGLGNSRASLERTLPPELFAKVKPVWGFDEEGEIQGVYRDLGLPGLWVMMGNLALCRFHSKHIALQIKAMEEGLFGERYIV